MIYLLGVFNPGDVCELPNNELIIIIQPKNRCRRPTHRSYWGLAMTGIFDEFWESELSLVL